MEFTSRHELARTGYLEPKGAEITGSRNVAGRVDLRDDVFLICRYRCEKERRAYSPSILGFTPARENGFVDPSLVTRSQDPTLAMRE